MDLKLSLYSSTLITLNHASSTTKSRRVTMHANNRISSNLKIQSILKNKVVFEDPIEGIVCYVDDNGETICEGYEEGPRLSQQQSRITNYSSKDVEIIDLLQRCWLHVADEEEEYKNAEKGIIKQTDFDCNESNKCLY